MYAGPDSCQFSRSVKISEYQLDHIIRVTKGAGKKDLISAKEGGGSKGSYGASERYIFVLIHFCLLILVFKMHAKEICVFCIPFIEILNFS